MITGGCQCGGVRYEADTEPTDVYCCHCRECRKQSASALGISVIFPAGAMRLTAGTPSVWRQTVDNGGVKECTFCPTCGTRLWHAGNDDGTLSIKGGSLDIPPDLSAAKHIWLKSKLAGVIITDGAECWDREPA